MKDLKIGKYVVVDDEPCRVVGIESSAPGKHGAAKMRVTAKSLFTGNKKTIMKPSDADCEVPLIERMKGQIVALMGDSVQIMNSDTFETFEMAIPEEFKSEIVAGKNVDYMVAMSRKLITRIY